MKIIAKPVEMVLWVDIKGIIHPTRFRIANDDDSSTVIKVDKVITRDEEKFAGNRMLVLKCQSVINGVEKIYELKYEFNTCKWMLYKI